jgi:hypothetical protein
VERSEPVGRAERNAGGAAIEGGLRQFAHLLELGGRHSPRLSCSRLWLNQPIFHDGELELGGAMQRCDRVFVVRDAA